MIGLSQTITKYIRHIKKLKDMIKFKSLRPPNDFNEFKKGTIDRKQHIKEMW